MIGFRPSILRSLRGYDSRRFGKDLAAGLVVGVVALPLALAFAIASGVTPQAGIATAIIGGFVISALGGSRVQIGGPTGAFVVILYGVVVEHGPEKLFVCTFMAGVILVIMGVARFGRVIQYIPWPVTMGFTSGIAVVIFSSQVASFLGLPIESLEPDFLGKCRQFVEHAASIDVTTMLLGLGSVVLILAWPKSWARKVPASIVALILAGAAASLLGLSVETIGSRFGELPRGLPAFRLPDLSLETIKELIGPATTIALLGAIESLLSAVVADGLIDDRHDPDQELVAQGVANMATPLFGGFAATGAIARTATNVRSGATSPVAGIVHSVTLLVLVLAAAPLASAIPLSTLAAILLVVSARMGEWHIFRRLLRLPRGDAIVFVTTFALTVLADLTVAVEVGVVLAAVLFIERVSRLTSVAPIMSGTAPHSAGSNAPTPHAGVEVYHVQGAFFFGTANRLESTLRRISAGTHTLVLVVDQVIDIDATGLNSLETLRDRLERAGGRLVLCGVRVHVRHVLETSGFARSLGPGGIVATLEDVLKEVPSSSATSPGSEEASSAASKREPAATLPR